VPEGWSVLVLADRGLYAKWLFRGIRKLGWHPLLRVNQGGKFRPKGWHHFVPMASLVPCPGRCWRGRGMAFRTAEVQLPCTLLAFWGEGHAEAWLLLTDLAPQVSDASWYGLRSWVEQFFKDGKRGGWQWQHTRMTDPARAERLWLAIAVATLWLVRVGGENEVREGGLVASVERGRGVGSAQGTAVALGERIRSRLDRHRGGAVQAQPRPSWPAGSGAVADAPEEHTRASGRTTREKTSGMKTYT